jgi:hypothetical protein
VTSVPQALRPLLRRPLLGTPEARRRVLHGDWHPLLRDPIDLLRLNYLVGAIVFFAIGKPHQALDLVFSAVAVFVVRAVDPPRRIDLAFIVAMLFNGWGDALSLFNTIAWYDNLVHVTVPLALGPLGYIALVRLDVVPSLLGQNTPRHRLGMAIIAAALGITGAAIYEVYEFAVDTFLGADLFISESDTANDLFDGLVGGAIGGALLAALAASSVPTRRGPLPSKPSGRRKAARAAQHQQRAGGEAGGAEAGEQDRAGVQERPAGGAVEDDARRRPDRGTDREVPRAHAREPAGVVEGAHRHPGSHPQQDHGAGAAVLEPGGGGADPGGQPLLEPPPAERAHDPERGERPQRAPDQRHPDAERAEQQAAGGAQQRAGDQQRRAGDPYGEQHQRRPGSGRGHEVAQDRRVARDEHHGGHGERRQQGDQRQP